MQYISVRGKYMKYVIHTNYAGMNVVWFDTLEDIQDFITFCKINRISFTTPKLTILNQSSTAC